MRHLSILLMLVLLTNFNALRANSGAKLETANSSKRIECSNNCSGNGICKKNGVCKCKIGFQGNDCSEFKCPNICLKNGQCVGPRECKCNEGFKGRNCNIPDKSNTSTSSSSTSSSSGSIIGTTSSSGNTTTSSSSTTGGTTNCTFNAPVKCPDGSCIKFGEKCGATSTSSSTGGTVNNCPLENPIQCFNGTCVKNEVKCVLESGCPTSAPFQCQKNGICHERIGLCVGGAPFIICHCGTQGVSGNGGPNCSDIPMGGCSTVKDYVCSCDGVTFQNACGSAVAGVRAFVRGVCKSSNTTIMCFAPTQFECSDGSCVAAPKDCPGTRGCIGANPFPCIDGRCAADEASCSPTLYDQINLPFVGD